MSQIEKNKLSHQPKNQWYFLTNLIAQKLAKLDQKNRSEILPSDLFEYLAPSLKNFKGQKQKPKKIKVSRGDSLLKRIVFSVSQIETQYNPTGNLDALESDFFNLMARGEFVPEISLLKNINQGGQSLTAQYSIPVNNGVENILESIKQVIQVYQCGASPYLDLNDLRLNPISFLQLLSQTCLTLLGEVTTNQNSVVLLRIDHPSIFDFIENFNQESISLPFQRSIGLTPEFLNAIIKNDVFNLSNGKQIQARSLFKVLLSRILDGARINLVFLDAAQKTESFLFPYETCPQGFINLSVMYHHQEINWEKLKTAIHRSIHFLDNVIEANNYPFKEAQEVTHHHRGIGLGIMGFADLLNALKITYGSDESFQIAEKIIGFITQEAGFASEQLALVRGAFPNFSLGEVSTLPVKRRNQHLIFLADSHHESQLIGCSSSLLPKHNLKLNPKVYLRMGAIFQRCTEGRVYQEIPLPQNIKNSELTSLIFLAFETKLESITFIR